MKTAKYITVHRQAILLLFVESGTRKLRKVVESRTKFAFDVERVLDSTKSSLIYQFQEPKLNQFYIERNCFD